MSENINAELLSALKAVEQTAVVLGIVRGEEDDAVWLSALTAHLHALDIARSAIQKAEA
jgi:hypothetical protein